MPIDKKTFDQALRLKEEVLAFLMKKKGEGKGYSCPEIALEMGADWKEVGKALSALCEEKKIQRITYMNKFYYRCI